MNSVQYINLRLIIAAGLAVFAVASGLDAQWRLVQEQASHRDAQAVRLERSLDLAADALNVSARGQGAVASVLGGLARDPSITFAGILAGDDRIVAAVPPRRLGQRLSDVTGLSSLVVTKVLESGDGKLAVVQDLGPEFAAISRAYWGAALRSISLAVLITLIVGVVATRHFSRTTRRIASLVQKLGDVVSDAAEPDNSDASLAAQNIGEAYRLTTGKLSRRLERLEQARERLAERGDYFEVTLRSIGDAVILTNTDGAVTGMNAMAEELTGWSEAEAEGEPLTRVFRASDPAAGPGVLLSIEELLGAAGAKPGISELLLRARDDSEHRVTSTAGEIRGDHESRGIVLVFRDVTDEYALREALAASERRLSAAIEGGQVGVWEWHALTDAFEHVGTWHYRLSDRYANGVASGQQLLEVTHADDRARCRHELARHLRCETADYEMEQRVGQSDGTYRHFLIRGRVVQRDGDGRAVRMVGTSTDVTELRQQQQRLQLALKFGGQGLFQWRPDENLLELSDSWYELFDHPYGSVTTAEAFATTVNPADRALLRDLTIDASRDGTDAEVEFRLLTGGGEERWVLARGVFDQRDERGRVSHVLGTMLDITALKQSRESLQLALDAARLGIGEWWPETDRLVLDASWYQLTGWQRGEIETLQDLAESTNLHEADRDGLVDMLHNVAAGTNEVGEAEFRLRFSSGEFHWMRGSVRVVQRDGDGRPVRVVGTILDVTDLRHVEQQVELAVEASRQGIWEWFPDGDRLVTTTSWSRLTGYADTAFASMSDAFAHMVHPGDATAGRSLLASLSDGEHETAEMEVRMRRSDGEYLWFILRATVAGHDADGVVQRIIGTVFDISDLKAAEESLEMALETSRQGLLEWRPQEDTLLPASSWLQLTGYAPGEIVSIDQLMDKHIVHPDDQDNVRVKIARLLAGEVKEISDEFRIRTQSGEYLWVLARAYAAERDPTGAIRRVISTHIDINELKRADERLQLAVESGRQGLWQWIPETDRLEPLANWWKLTGYDPGEFDSMAACYERGVIHEQDQKAVVAELEALMHGERDQGEIEFRIRQKSGDYFWALTRIIVAERGADGFAARIVGVNIDITERRVTEERLDVALGASRQGTWEWSLHDDAFYADARWRELFQVEARDVASMEDVINDVVHPLDQDYVRSLCKGSRTLVDDNGESEFRLRGADGGTIWVLARSVVTERDHEHRPRRMVGVTIDINDRKEAETRIALAVESARLGLWNWLPQTGEIQFPDDSWSRITGHKADAVTDLAAVERLIHPDDKAATAAALAPVQRGDVDTFETNLRLRTKDGPYRWFLVRGRTTDRDEAGRPLRVAGTSFDLTELKETQRELEASREFLQIVLDTVPESIFWKDADSRYLGANRRFAMDAGFSSPEDLIGLSDYDMVWQEYADQLRHEDASIIAGEHHSVSTERSLRTANNTEMWVSTSKVPLLGGNENPIGVLGVFRDITAYRRTLDALQDERDRLELIMRGTGVGIWEADIERDRVEMNDRCAELFGYDVAEAASIAVSTWVERVHPDDRATYKAAAHQRSVDTNGRYECDYRIRHGLGHWMWIHDVGRVTQWNRNGEPARVSGIAIDISARMERDAHLKTIAEAMTRSGGGGLLGTVVRAAQELCEVEAAFVGAFDESQTHVTVINAWPPDPAFDGFEYPVAGSPCEAVMASDTCIFPAQVAERFPADLTLRDMNIESYAGRRLLDDAGVPRGVFFVVDSKPIANVDRITSVLDILASTAGYELERERRNNLLRDSETRYRQTFEKMPVLLCTIDEKGTVVDVNEAWCRLSGRARAASIGAPLTSFFTDRAAETVASALASGSQLVSGNREYLEFHRTDGEVVTAAYTLFGAGQVSGTDYRILALEDVSARVRAEQQLRIAATAFETHGAIAVADRDRKILQVNEAFTELTQYAQGEAIGAMPELLKSRRHNEHFYREIWHEVAQFSRWEGEMWGRRKDGSEFPVWQAITAVFDDDQELTHYVINMLDITDRVRAEREIERLAFYDSLTGLANRRYLLDRLEVVIASTARRGTFGALLFIDLDHFKHINDSMGHSIGDAVLIQVAQRLDALTRQEDMICRLGGDEFILLLGEVGIDLATARTHTGAVADKIREEISRPYIVERQEFHITPTIGISLFPENADTPAEILKEADSAMYHGKTEGRNNWRFYDPAMAASATERIELENELRTAVENGQLELHFQPQVRAEYGIVGAEALVRWIHPERGFVPPDKFIPIAEDSALIHDLGRWIIDRALEVAAGWLRDGLDFIDHLAINLSSRQFRAADFVTDLEQRRARSGVPARFIVLELTEHAVIDDIDGTIVKMNELRELGFRFSVDDFGIGYSSLAYLRRLPLDQLKIDRSFVLDVVEDMNAGVIAETIIAMGRQLGLETIAEGVETEEQRDFLLDRGCEEFQGYLYCRPIPDEQFRAFCRDYAGAAVGE